MLLNLAAVTRFNQISVCASLPLYRVEYAILPKKCKEKKFPLLAIAKSLVIFNIA
jgi:hypothetical protein